MKMSLGKRIKETRRTAQMTQLELAERAGVTYGTVVNIERDRGSPRIKSVMAIAHALGVSIGELAGTR